MAKENRIMYKNKMNRHEESLQKSITESNQGKGWMNTTKEIMREINVEETELQNTKNITKTIVKSKINETFKTEIEKTSKEKHKVQYLREGANTTWTPRARPIYMNKLTRLEVSTIFKSRTRMLDIKNNYRGKYTDLVCRGCGKKEETQQHILEECEGIHENNNTKTTMDDIFTEDIEKLKNTVKKINKIILQISIAPH